jgi:hypothetical protein
MAKRSFDFLLNAFLGYQLFNAVNLKSFQKGQMFKMHWGPLALSSLLWPSS